MKIEKIKKSVSIFWKMYYTYINKWKIRKENIMENIEFIEFGYENEIEYGYTPAHEAQ